MYSGSNSKLTSKMSMSTSHNLIYKDGSLVIHIYKEKSMVVKDIKKIRIHFVSA